MLKRTLPALLFASLLGAAPPQQNVRGPSPSDLQSAGFELARPNWNYEFPRDHGTHDEFRTEWWYYTGHLRTSRGRDVGFEVTFFRVGVRPPGTPRQTSWDLQNVSLAHFAVTDISNRKFRYYERMNRSSRFTANAEPGRLHVFNESWSATTLANGSWRLRASSGDDALDLVLRSAKPPAIHGENGISVKAIGEGYASHYYSMTRLIASGSATVGGDTAAVEGLAWMDHEFGSAVLRENQQGWDWFSVQLDSNIELMLYEIRKQDGAPDVTSSGSLILEDGSVVHLKAGDFRITPVGRWKSPKSGGQYPMGWRVEVPAHDLSLLVRERMADQELRTKGSTRVTYWEGAVAVSGSFGGTAVRGQGYVEMTGYAK